MSALYVYAIVPSDLGNLDVRGIGGAAVRILPEGDLGAVVHDLADAQPYGGSDEEVRNAVAEHAAVVEAAWSAAGVVVPVTFDVIVAAAADATAEDRLRGWLRGEAEQLTAKLAALNGLAELKVEIAIDPLLLPPSPEIEQARADLETRSPGARRLFERKLLVLERGHAERSAADLYSDVRRRLAAVSNDLAEQRGHRPAAPLVPLFAAALLVSRDAVEAVGRALAELHDEHPYLAIRFLGPWPPYSFTDGASPLP